MLNIQTSESQNLWSNPKLQTFPAYFSEFIEKNIIDLSQKTINLRKKRNTFILISVLVVFFEFVLSLIFKTLNIELILILSSIPAIFVCYVFVIKPSNKLNKEFKTTIIPLLFNFLVPQGAYTDKVEGRSILTPQVAEDIFGESLQNPNLIITAEDMFSGKAGNIPFAFCELNLTKIIPKHESGSNSKQQKKRLFNGIYVKSKFFDTGYEGFTYLIDHQHTSYNSHSLCGKLKLIKLESPDFNKFFKVLSNDQIEARVALKTNLMYELTELRKTIGSAVSLLITPEDIEIFVSSGSNLFELNLDKNLTNIDTYLDILVPLCKCLELVEVLNTNKQVYS